MLVSCLAYSSTLNMEAVYLQKYRLAFTVLRGVIFYKREVDVKPIVHWSAFPVVPKIDSAYFPKPDCLYNGDVMCFL
jgi:hypothetical protein